MSKLTDLRVLHDRFDVEAVNRNTRSASVSDLVEALREVGEVVETEDCVSGHRGHSTLEIHELSPGPYLLVRLGEGDAE